VTQLLLLLLYTSAHHSIASSSAHHCPTPSLGVQPRCGMLTCAMCSPHALLPPQSTPCTMHMIPAPDPLRAAPPLPGTARMLLCRCWWPT
jgi:hypothetical protein